MGRFVILSGPSCIGKGPLCRALKKFQPRLAQQLQKLVLYNSRRPRPVETDGIDYHFRPREEIESFKDNGDFLVMEVRGDLQALFLPELHEALRRGDAFFEGNPFVGRALLDWPMPPGVERLSVFLSPLSREELLELQAPERNVKLPDFVAELMRRKLLRRTRHQNTLLSLKDLEEIERRATSACHELGEAWRFNHVIPNHDGEDSENWSAFYYPVGDARKTLHAFIELLRGNVPPGVEHWEKDLLPASAPSI